MAAQQHGVIRRDQLTALGATKGIIQRRLETGRWERVEPNVFRLGGSPPSWRQSLMGVCLAWGECAVVSHRAAAAIWQLAGFEPGPIELTVPRGRKRAGGRGIVHYGTLLPSDKTTIESIPVTTPARTVIDLSSVAVPTLLEEALDDALRRGIVSVARLRRLVAGPAGSRRRGVALMRSLLNARESTSSVPQSVFETRMLRVLIQAGLPRPVLQFPIRHDNGVFRLDFAYPDVRMAIETDGYQWHSGRRRWEHDLARRNVLTLNRWRIIHVTWEDLVHRPETVTRSIREALADQPLGAG